jgi:hypothetical protein
LDPVLGVAGEVVLPVLEPWLPLDGLWLLLVLLGVAVGVGVGVVGVGDGVVGVGEGVVGVGDGAAVVGSDVGTDDEPGLGLAQFACSPPLIVTVTPFEP